MQRRILTKGQDLWFTFSDQPMSFSMRECHLTTRLAYEEDKTETEPLFREVKKPYLWMLSKGEKYTVRSLYDRLEEKARTMKRLERLSIGITIITEGIIIAGNTSSLIPHIRLMAYKNYDSFSKMAWGKLAYTVLSNSVKRLSASSWTGESYEVRGFVLAINFWAMSSVPMLGKALGKPCEATSSADPLCLHWDSTRSPTITEVLEVEKKNNGVVTTVFGFSDEFKHLVNSTHPDDKEFDSVKTLVDKAGQKTKMYNKTLRSKHKMKKNNMWKLMLNSATGQTLEEEEEQMETDTEVGEPVQVERQKRGRGTKGQTFEEEEEQMEADTEVEKPVQVERQKRGRGTKEQEHKKNEEKRKYEAYEKAKEKNQDEDSSMSNSEKLDKLIQIIHDLGKRVEVIEKVLVVKVPDGSSNKQDYENPANFFDDTKGAPNDENEEEENPGRLRWAGARCIRRLESPKETEATALNWAMQTMRRFGYKQVIYEIDSLILTKMIAGTKQIWPKLKPIIQEIKHTPSESPSFKVGFYIREGNKADLPVIGLNFVGNGS
ncbi:hypothetical protein Bca101_059440 [Brassica carinata]